MPEPASETPLLGRKLRQCLEAPGLIEGSHDYKAAVALFDTFPKDELFAAPAEDLRGALDSLLALEGTNRVRLLGRRDVDGRNASLILTLPRERYDAALGRARAAACSAAASGTAKVETHHVLDESARSRVHFLVHAPGELPERRRARARAEVIALAARGTTSCATCCPSLGPREGPAAEADGAPLPGHYKGYTSWSTRPRTTSPARAAWPRGGLTSLAPAAAEGDPSVLCTRRAPRSSSPRRCRCSRTSGCA